MLCYDFVSEDFRLQPQAIAITSIFYPLLLIPNKSLMYTPPFRNELLWHRYVIRTVDGPSIVWACLHQCSRLTRLISLGIVTLFNSVFNYLAMSYPTESASIFAGNALFRAALGASFSLFVCLYPSFRYTSTRPADALVGSRILQAAWDRWRKFTAWGCRFMLHPSNIHLISSESIDWLDSRWSIANAYAYSMEAGYVT